MSSMANLTCVQIEEEIFHIIIDASITKITFAFNQYGIPDFIGFLEHVRDNKGEYNHCYNPNHEDGIDIECKDGKLVVKSIHIFDDTLISHDIKTEITLECANIRGVDAAINMLKEHKLDDDDEEYE